MLEIRVDSLVGTYNAAHHDDPEVGNLEDSHDDSENDLDNEYAVGSLCVKDLSWEAPY